MSRAASKSSPDRRKTHPVRRHRRRRRRDRRRRSGSPRGTRSPRRRPTRPIQSKLKVGDTAPAFAASTNAGQFDLAQVIDAGAARGVRDLVPALPARDDRPERPRHEVRRQARDRRGQRQPVRDRRHARPESQNDVNRFGAQFQVRYPLAFDPDLKVAQLYLQGGFPTLVADRQEQEDHVDQERRGGRARLRQGDQHRHLTAFSRREAARARILLTENHDASSRRRSTHLFSNRFLGVAALAAALVVPRRCARAAGTAGSRRTAAGRRPGQPGMQQGRHHHGGFRPALRGLNLSAAQNAQIEQILRASPRPEPQRRSRHAPREPRANARTSRSKWLLTPAQRTQLHPPRRR